MTKLEIGPGNFKQPGYVRYGHKASPGGVDYEGPATKLPFPSNYFSEVYSCHCLEHVEWHDIEDTIIEWARVLASGGTLEIHTVDAEKLMNALLNWCPGDLPHPR